MSYPNFAVASLVLYALTIATPASGNEPLYFPYPREGVMLGQGWDTLTGRPTTDICVKFQEQQIAAHETTSQYTEVINRHHLDRLLKISASASYKGVVSASGSADYSKQTTINQNRHSILATISVISGSRFTAPTQLESVGQPIALLQPYVEGAQDQMQAPEFSARCGDSFVSYIEKGGELNAVFGFSETQRKVAESFALRLKASGYGASGSLSASGHTITDEQNKFVDIDVIQFGGPRMPSPVVAENFYETVRAFTASAGDDEFEEKAFRITVTPYTALHNGASKGRRAEFRALTMLQTLYSELRDSYQEIVTDYVNSGGIVDGGGAYASDANSKFAILDAGDHELIVGTGVDNWLSTGRDLSKMDKAIKDALTAELKRFGMADTMVCGKDIISKFPAGAPPANSLDAALPGYLVYLEAKRINGIAFEAERYRQQNVMREAIRVLPQGADLSPIMEFAFAVSKSESKSDVGKALAAIDRCLLFVDEHPWNIDRIEQSYQELGARILALNNLLELCTRQLQGSGPVDTCTDEAAAVKFVKEIAPKAISDISTQRRKELTSLATANAADSKFWMDLASTYNLNTTDKDIFDKGIPSTVRSQFDPIHESVVGPIAGEFVTKLCENYGLIPCYTIDPEQKPGDTGFITMTKNTEKDQRTQLIDKEVTNAERDQRKDLTDKELSSELIETYVTFYISKLSSLPLSKADLIERSGTPPSTIDQAALLTSDLNKFIFKSRLQGSVAYVCSVIPDLKLCATPADLITEFEVPAIPIIGRFEVSHDGCKKTGVRRVLDKKRHWALGGDKYRDESYCVEWGKIVDEYEFVRAAAQFGRN